MNKAGTLLLIVAALLFYPGEVQSQNSFSPRSARYLWPTNASSHLTSTFAETRSGHFHAALDIKTWGRKGYKVYATRDGIVDRLAVGPRGYGKVVYLKHDDGSYSVYAHLLSFNDRLQQLVDSVRIANDYIFETEQFLSWKNLKIEQGEVIGYSGASGIGPPHLHFELRTPSHKPFNPLLTNLSVADTLAPRISGIAIEPLSPRSSIEGENRILRKKAWREKEQFQLGTVGVRGPVGLAIDVFDQSNGVNNAYAVYELSLSVDGEQLFKSRVDSFSYGETGQMFIDRLYPSLLKKDGEYQRLYIADGNTLPFYQTGKAKGKLNLAPGPHTVTIRATDYFGNSSTASLNLRAGSVNIGKNTLGSGNKEKTSPLPSPHHWDWFSNWFSLSNHHYQQLTIAGSPSDLVIPHVKGITVDLRVQDNLFVNIPGTGPLNLRRAVPKSETILASGDYRHFSIFPEGTFYDTVSVGMSVSSPARDSITVDMIPEVQPINNTYHFYIERDSTLRDTSKLAFYKLDRYDDKEKWELIPTKFSRHHIIGNPETLGTFVSLRDTLAPVVENPRLRQRPDKQWILVIDAKDNLSGIDYRRSRISVNGQPGIAEYEPEDSRLVYYHPEFKPAGFLNIAITVMDKMGNRNTKTLHLGNKQKSPAN